MMLPLTLQSVKNLLCLPVRLLSGARAKSASAHKAGRLSAARAVSCGIMCLRGSKCTAFRESIEGGCAVTFASGGHTSCRPE